MWRIGVDVGGTFTDLFGWHTKTGEQAAAKVLTTKDRSHGVIQAIETTGISFPNVSHLIHGTTTATNILIERSYPPGGMIATEGFRDTIEIGRQHRAHLYDPYQDKPKPIIPRRYRFGVSERINVSGHVERPLDRDMAVMISKKIRDYDLRSVAICFINSYINSEHEEAMQAIVEERCPNVKVVTSSSTRPLIREHGRFSTTAIRSVLLPVMSEYFALLQERLDGKGFNGSLLVLKSSGGVMGVDLASQHPEELIESGPAGGVACTVELSRQTKRHKLIHTDMGGTSFDASIVENGHGLVTRTYELEWEVPIIVPMLDIHSVGAGGGSIGWVDDGDSLRVGPRSAGSIPGPACYARGGTEATVTDANLVLGRLEPTLSGKFELDVAAAESAIEVLSRRVGLPLLETAEGIIKICCENMARAVKMVLVKRGRDPRDFALASLGGAGAMHAVFVARAMNVPEIIVPRFAGVASAFGATTMNLRQDVETFMYAPLSSLNLERINALYAELEGRARELLYADGVVEKDVTVGRSAQMRYVGQTYEVETPIPAHTIDAESIQAITDAFHNVHRQEYGVSSEDFEPAFVSLAVTATGATPKPTMSVSEERSQTLMKSKRRVYFSGNWYDAAIIDGEAIRKGDRVKGPAIVEYDDACAVLPPGSTAFVDAQTNLIARVGTE